MTNRLDALVPGMSGDNLGIELAGRFDVVVDAADACLLQVAGLLLAQRADIDTVADAVNLLCFADDFQDLRPFLGGRAAAAVDDSESAGAPVLGELHGLGNLTRLHQRMRLDAGI